MTGVQKASYQLFFEQLLPGKTDSNYINNEGGILNE